VRSHAEQLAVVRGWGHTRATLRRWNARPFATVAPWALGGVAIAALLLGATWAIAALATPDPSVFAFHGGGAWSHYGLILYRNSLVLALHAMACVAGFIAGSSLAVEGRAATLHDRAGKLALGFVAAATLFSLGTQAYALGLQASSIADAHAVTPALLMLSILPHALPELTALFLPLAAWLLASRREAWDELLAATFATTAVAAPVLMVAAAIEVWLSPHVLSFLK
jgi:Stage II sporulation protein M